MGDMSYAQLMVEHVEEQQRRVKTEAENHRLCKENERLRAENERLKAEAQENWSVIGETAKDAERYQWGLAHPAWMARFFIEYRSKCSAGSNNRPGDHPSDRIDEKRGKHDE
jgi:hypothetical protein